MQDLRFAVRTLLRRPGFTVAAIVTLAVGIGATVSIFSVVNGVLLSPLAFPDSEDLVVLWTRNTETGLSDRGFDHPDIRAVEANVTALDIVGFGGTRPTLSGFGDPRVVFGTRATDGLIRLMGLEPVFGRDIRAEDDIEGGPRVVVVSHDFWMDQFSGDPDVVGRSITLNDVAWEVIGVAPPAFDFPNSSELWMPRRHEDDGCDHGCRVLNAVGRVRADRGMADAGAELAAASAQIAEQFPNSHRGERFELESMLAHEVSDVRTALWVLLGAVGMVLLIACANVANLLLVRASGRRTEVALRGTLGASRFRIVRQLLTESALLAVLAGVMGLVLAYWGTAGLASLAPDELPRLDEVRLSGVVFGFTAALVLLVTALFGVLPALHASSDVATGNGGRRTSGFRGAGRSRSLLLVGEVALSLTLLLGAGLLLRTLGEMRALNLGFDAEGIERFRISVPGGRYDSIAVGSFFQELETELTRLPTVASAGWGFGVPMAVGNISSSVVLLDRPGVAPPDRPEFAVRPATAGFLDATGTRLLQGRWFDERDRYGAQPVAVINQAAARLHYPGVDPIGLLLKPDVTWGFERSPDLTIVGIVEDVVRTGPWDEPEAAVYLPNTQFGASTGYMSLRLAPGTTSAISDARRVVGAMDPSLAIWDEANMQDVVALSRAPTLFYALLLSAFSMVALLLAAVGLYGVVAYMVAQRTHEIGVRIALGAASDQVTGMVLREGIRPALMGIAVGLALSWAGARVLSSMLYGVAWGDPRAFLGVSVLLLAVTATATAIPARRASHVPPATALRAD